MTEQEAIKRIEWALKQSGMRGWGVEKAAEAAWNEMKAIAREDVCVKVTYGSFTLHQDGSKTWHPNPNLPLTAEEQHTHNWPA